MKTTIEIPDAVFRQAKALEASRGISLKRFFTEALQEHIRRRTSKTDPPWMAGFGVLSDLSDENRRILKDNRGGLVTVEASFRAADRLVVPSALYESAN